MNFFNLDFLPSTKKSTEQKELNRKIKSLILYKKTTTKTFQN